MKVKRYPSGYGQGGGRRNGGRHKWGPERPKVNLAPNYANKIFKCADCKRTFKAETELQRFCEFCTRDRVIFNLPL